MGKIRVAITGSEGFLGKHLVDSLKNKENIVLILFDKNKNSLFDPKTLEVFLKNADVVAHLAGANRDSDYNLFKNNIIATAGLLDGMKKYCPRAKIIFSSSFQAYDEKSPYGLSKKLAEDATLSFSRIYGIRSIILRISNIYGKGGKPFYNSVIATFTYLIKNKKPIVINGTGEQKRDYIYVEDVVNAIIKAIGYNSLNARERFDICSEELTSINQLVGLLRQYCNKKEIKIEYNKKHKETRGEVKRSYSKAERNLLWRPKVKIKDGLKRTMD